MANLSKKMDTRTLYSLNWPNTIHRLESGKWTGSWGAVQLFVFDGSDLPARVIAATNDSGRWVFHNHGKPFHFEELERYSLRKIRKRFDEALLLRYLDALGANGYEDRFWNVDPHHPVYMIERHDTDPFVAEKFNRPVSLAEAARRIRGEM